MYSLKSENEVRWTFKENERLQKKSSQLMGKKNPKNNQEKFIHHILKVFHKLQRAINKKKEKPLSTAVIKVNINKWM